ncbi:MAG: hypothetical protein IPL65_14595 [Lewinellaceae bacterium]|nr:hypothetical protein [Lewinellaceae bacterium]
MMVVVSVKSERRFWYLTAVAETFTLANTYRLPNLKWDGMVPRQAGMHPADVYVWVAAIRYSDGRLEEMRGDLTLIR